MGAEVGSYLIAAVQVDLGLLFLAAAVTKLRAPRQLIRAVAAYGIVPWAAPAVGPALIASEGFVGAALVSGRMLAVASLVAVGWLAVFALATGVNLRQGRTLPCYCFGAGRELIGGRTLARIGLVGAGVVLVAVARLTAPVPTPAALGPTELVATASLALCLALVAAWLLRAGELWALARGAARTGQGR